MASRQAEFLPVPPLHRRRCHNAHSRLADVRRGMSYCRLLPSDTVRVDSHSDQQSKSHRVRDSCDIFDEMRLVERVRRTIPQIGEPVSRQ
jgi:hypothetical protein